jgi:transposase
MKIELDKENLPDDLNALKDYSIKIGVELNESNRKILFLEEQINLLNQKIFGRKSEKSEKKDSSPNLFDPAELPFSKENEAETTVTVKEHQRKTGGGRKGIDPSLPVDETIIHDLSEEEKKCNSCGKHLPSIGYESRKQADIIPQKRKIIEHRIMKYGPCDCEESILKEEPEVKESKMPARIIPGSMLAEGALSYIITGKFVDGIPFYRQEKILERFGIYITRQTMCDNAISIYNACTELLELMLELVRSGMSINMDETTMKVVTEENKTVNSKCYMWVMVGRTKDLKKIVYFHYDPSRSGSIPDELLKGFQGYLQTDGLKAYNASVINKKIIHAGCNAHARREFDEAAKAGKNLRNPNIALAFYRRIYKIEKDLREELLNGTISETIFEEKRKENVMPFFDKFKKWMLKMQHEVLPQSLTGKAIRYTLKEWGKLIRYLDKWYLTPDNNTAENAIRPFVIGRKNWLFSFSAEGARANACFYSLLETAKINMLNPFYYLRYLLIKLPLAKSRSDLLKLLPINLTNDEIMKI